MRKFQNVIVIPECMYLNNKNIKINKIVVAGNTDSKPINIVINISDEIEYHKGFAFMDVLSIEKIYNDNIDNIDLDILFEKNVSKMK